MPSFCHLLFTALLLGTGEVAAGVLAKRYLCANDVCQLQPSTSKTPIANLSFAECVLSCEHGRLWPLPTGAVQFGNSLLRISFQDISCIFGSDVLLKAACDYFQESLGHLLLPAGHSTPSLRSGTGTAKVTIIFAVTDLSVRVASIDNDESYTLKTELSQSGVYLVSITAQTFFGARHGLETLSQLFAYDKDTNTQLMLSDVSIQDKPRFRYRGVMLDVARNFLPPSKIKETIRAMSYNKLNVLHLHLTDTASFPVNIQGQPEMTQYGAYDNDKVYDAATLADIETYANELGVMLLPEIDAPAHVAAGWEWGSQAGMGDLVLCADYAGTGGTQWASHALEPPSGQFNLVNDNAYNVLGRVYDSVISSLGKSGYFHFGGDEVIVGSDESWASCYNSSILGKPVIDYLRSHGLDRSNPDTFYKLWEDFVARAGKMVGDSFAKAAIPSRKIHVWGASGGSSVTYSMITRPEVTTVLPSSQYTIQVWDSSSGSIAKTLIQKGYQVVLSNYDYTYLDCGGSGWARPGGYWCQPYHEWYHIYDYINDVKEAWSFSPTDLDSVLGAETLAWAETIDESNLAQKLWPRTAALAEALWSHNVTQTWFEADARLHYWRQVLVGRGIAAEALWPYWCSQRQDNACTLHGGTPQ